MNILAVDTTTKIASVSIKNNEKIYMDKITNEITHSEKLLPLIDKVLTDSKLTLNDLSILACINGPGSFTGIRIGLATIKALAQVTNLNIFSISSLELLAYLGYNTKGLHNPQHVISIVSTNNDRVFYSIYKTEKMGKKIDIKDIIDIKNSYIDEAILEIKDTLNINNISKDFCIVGNCINRFKEELLALDCLKYDIYPDTNDCINAFENINDVSKYTFNVFSLNAIYALPSQAERLKNGKN